MTNPATQGNNVFLPPSPVAPMVLEIASITQTNQMVVTTTTPNYWIVGQKAYFSIPFEYLIHFQSQAIHFKMLLCPRMAHPMFTHL